MIAWSIEAARASELFNQVVVSTDDEEIADVARQWGAEVPFMRPIELADDYVGIPDVMAHAVHWGLQHEGTISAVCCLSATAPLVRADDLKSGLQALNSGEWAYAFAATDFAAPIFRSFREHPEGGVEMFFPEHFTTRSQDLPVALHDAGQFYWGRPSAWAARKLIFSRDSFPVVIPRWRVQDIDTGDDWFRAEAMYRAIVGR
jgi:pseudaminic acid cytidylyltransferase